MHAVSSSVRAPVVFKFATAVHACLITPWILRFFVLFGSIWGSGWFIVKLVLTDLTRPDGKVVNNAGRLRYTVVQYQVEFILETLQDHALNFSYVPERSAKYHHDSLIHITGGLSGTTDLGSEGIPEASDKVKANLAAFVLNLTTFDSTWQAIRNHRHFSPQEFVQRVNELTSLLRFTDRDIVDVVADVATSRANQLYWVSLITGAIGACNTLVIIVFLFFQLGTTAQLLDSKSQRFQVLRQLLQLCMGITAYMDSVDSVVSGSDEFEELCGRTSLVDACWSEQEEARCRAFLVALQSTAIPNKIRLSLRTKLESFRLECDVCGVIDGSRFLLGIQIIDKYSEDAKSEAVSAEWREIITESAVVQLEVLENQFEFPILEFNANFASLCGALPPKRFDLLSLVVESTEFRCFIREHVNEVCKGFKDLPQRIEYGALTLVPGIVSGSALGAHKYRATCILFLPELPVDANPFAVTSYTVVLYFRGIRQLQQSVVQQKDRHGSVAPSVLFSRLVELTRHLRATSFDVSISILSDAVRTIEDNRESYRVLWGKECTEWVCEFCFAANDVEDVACSICLLPPESGSRERPSSLDDSVSLNL